MGFIGDLAKTILITWVVFWISAMIWFLVTGQFVMASLFIVGFIIPLSFILYEYRLHRRKQ